MKRSLLALLAVVSLSANADQIERETAEALGLVPQGVMVKVDPVTKIVEVYQAPSVEKNQSLSSEKMAEQISKIEISANKIAEFKVGGELEESSTQACWYGRGWGWYGYTPYSYGYNCYRPYAYNSYFTYSRYSYNYGYGCNYNRYNYGWYY